MKLYIPKSNTYPCVSVITPSYNSARFITETIQSVQQQTYEQWEMIIIDDGSTDDSVSIITEYIKNDSRIRLLSLKQNVGIAAARNIGLKEARGKYVAFLDSDDIWFPHKLYEQISFMKEKNVAFSYTSYCYINEDGENLDVHVQAPVALDYYDLVGNTVIGCLTVMLDRTKIPHVEMPMIRPEDTALWLSLLKQGYKANGLQQVLAKYRIVNNSVSRNKLKAALQYWKLLRQQESFHVVKAAFYFSKYAYHAYQKNKGCLVEGKKK
ncbi:glycosyltransferase family 2 protein [Bacillus rhizoplanae]|uniref:glycosyltransferase family 2 protein n=1 Tax=Bacillus rhizoplanae TaxID=2880966 RepID=UPI003D1E28E2